MKNSTKLDNTITRIIEFIESMEFAENSVPNNFYGNQFTKFFMKSEEGALFLDKKDTLSYYQILQELYSCVDGDKISRKKIEDIFQNTILFCLDINKKRPEQTLRERITQAVEYLKKELFQKDKKFIVYYQVLGLLPDGLPIKIGNVNFDCFTDLYKKPFIDAFHSSTIEDGNVKEFYSDYINTSQINNKIVAYTEVHAVDKEAAKKLALKETRFIVNIVNFIKDFIPYNSGFIFFPGECEKGKINIPVIEKGEKPRYSFGSYSVGPVGNFSFGELKKIDDEKNFGFQRLNSLLLDKMKNKLTERLLSAMNWAGKANVEENRELAFLFYAISLETLLLIENDNAELNYRLSLRIAYLLGTTKEDKKTIQENVRNLYNTRSKIVHSGKYEVTDAEFYLIKNYSRICISRIFIEEQFKNMNQNEFIRWFDDQIIK